MVRNGEDNYNIYKITKNKKFNFKKLMIIIVIILIIVLLTIIAKRSIDTINYYNIYKQYEMQLSALEKQEQERQKKIEQEKIQQEKIREARKERLSNIYHSETKRVFLTFDDGPSTVTPTILDILKQENIKATFFVLGSRVEAMPDMVKRAYEEGHYIANHGYSHSYSSIYSSPQAVLDEYNQCNDAVKKAIGKTNYNSHLFRFPGGLPGGPYATLKSEAKELLEQNDILQVDWNALSGDAETTKPTIEFEMKRIQETVGEKNSAVILMHDAQAKRVTADALPQIISWLKENGYEFKNFYEIIKP